MSEYAVICPNCKQLINSNSHRCPNCGALNHPAFRYFSQFNQLNSTQALIGINVAFFLFSLLLGYKLSGRSSTFGFLNLFSPNDAILSALGWADPSEALSLVHSWTLISSIFLHGGFFHILFNMLWLNQLYPMNEQLYGKLNTFSIYILSGLSGAIFATFFGHSPVIGASGAIFGLLTAYIVAAKSSGHIFLMMSSRSYLNLAIVMLVIGFLMPGVSNLSHLGGALAGFGIGKVLNIAKPNLTTRGILFAVCFFITLGALLIALFQVYTYLF